MKIRLRVRPSPTESFDWEHPGPRIRIGKEDCQLAFREEGNVSRRHAEIELSSTGAVLRDIGSKNGTYINGAPVAGAAMLSVGDEVSLGMGGPRLKVLSIELAAVAETARTGPVSTSLDPPSSQPSAAADPSSAPRPTTLPGVRVLRAELKDEKQRKRMALGAVALAACAALLIAGTIVWLRTGKKSEAPDATEAAEADTIDEPLAVTEPPAPSPPASATSTPSPPAVPSPPAKPIEEAVKPFEAAVVWLGFELDDAQFVYATAWALGPEAIVTSGETAHNLQFIVEKSRSTDHGPARIIARDARGTVGVKEFRIHPAYSASHAENDVDISQKAAHNIAVGILEAALPQNCSLASDAEIDGLNVHSPLLVVGFANDAGTKEPFDKIKGHVRLERKTARVSSSDPPGAEQPRSYRLTVGGAESLAGPLENLAGAPVFNEHGHVVGVLAILGNSIRMSSVRNNRGWIKESVP